MPDPSQPLASPAPGPTPEPRSPDPRSLSTGALIDLIVERHHGFAREALPLVRTLAEKVARVHGRRHLVVLADGVEELACRLLARMDREERVLFPALAAGAPLPAELAAAVEDHRAVDGLLGRLRAVAEGYQAPPEACRSWSALYDGLERLEDDVQRHARLEEDVLFARFAG